MDDRNSDQPAGKGTSAMEDTMKKTASSDASEVARALNPFFGTARQVVHRYTHCVVCGSNLHFTQVTDFSRNLTSETVRCPECGLKARKVLHRLQ
jgi:hypothetical protein